MFSTLEKTGGPWQLRTTICRLACHNNDKTHNHSHGEFSALYRAIGIFARSGKNAEALLLYNAIHSGDEEAAVNLATDCLVRLLKKGGASSSARYSHFDGDDDGGDDESVSSIRVRLKALKQKKLFLVLLPVYVLFMLMLKDTISRGVYFPELMQRKAMDVLEDTVGYGTRPIIPPVATSSITPPLLLSVDPSRPRHVSKKVNNLSYTDYRSLVIANATSVHVGNGFEIFWQEDSRRKNFQVKELAMWTDYIHGCVDPVLKLQPPSEQRLIILVGDSYTGPGMMSYAGGFYAPPYDFLFVRGASTVTRPTAIRVLVHELVHRFHRRIPTEDYTTITTHARINLLEMVANVEEEAQMLLYLHRTDVSLTYHEAMSVMSSVLDRRIKDVFENAKKSPAYRGWQSIKYSYALSNHYEFWAEASESYIVGWSINRFPDREWIRTNDPALFKLLGRVWSGMTLI